MTTGIIFSVLALFISFIITLKAIPAIIKVSKLKNLMDKPDGERKLHKNVVPNLGGVGMFAGFIIAYGVAVSFDMPSYFPALISAVTILFFVGIKDDILVIAPLKKLAGQIVAAAIIVFIGKIQLPGLDGLFGIAAFPPIAGQVFSVLTIIFIINAYNLIDGVDGLAGMIAIVASYVFGLWFLWGGHYAEAVLSFSLAGALVGFMFHNFEPARIFMGDTGSLIIGFILSVAAFRLVQLNPGTNGLVLQSPAIFVLSVMSIPVFDTLRVIVIRLSKGVSPMKADANHMHHFLVRLGLRHYQVALVLAFFNMVIVITSLFLQSWNVYLYLGVVILMAASILPIIHGTKSLLIRLFVSNTSTSSQSEYFLDNILLNDIMNEVANRQPKIKDLSHSKIREKEYLAEAKAS
ncbi:MAG: undecaprenyl/decaprenyl-phosphate alpha-N-acetylglucosaminyl 1-phosphate transferase [Bacteroidetes bacterium]|nr:MAG: undecaprenyl/decaprenyl-phosphate alpha-N-acetylglucosaminyl 1-phosphate transferase [Bacteroidota bacterium]